MRSDELTALASLQTPEGGFPSVVSSARGSSEDVNGFITALVLRTLRHLEDQPGWDRIRERALDWLWACRSSKVAGAFGFWPEHARPTWAYKVPPDIDDTAMMCTELYRYGRIDRATALRSLCTVILPLRVAAIDLSVLPQWVVPGAFFTWILEPEVRSHRRRLGNVVDCCVNVNVVALMALLVASHLPGHEGAVRTLLSGLDWAGDEDNRLASLTPYYPSPGPLVEAIDHAVECGADSLRAALAHPRLSRTDIAGTDAACCRSIYGRTTWHSPAVNLARSIAARSTPASEPERVRR